ncbi:MAG: molybdopterin-dependent oxidoreductase, partial [Candidatus Binatia bacterium]
MTLSRRRLLELGAGAAGGLLLVHARIARAECKARFADAVDRERLEARGISPYDLATLRDRITPTGAFFVRSHFGSVLVRDARIEVGGRVARPGTWTLDDLRRLPRREAAVTLECAGNSLAQGQGLVSTARFGGAALADLLRAAGAPNEDGEVVFTGADGASQGGEGYARSMKVREALAAESLLAWEMNGAPLPIDHGAPLRLLVPGWYGMASVKWLRRIELRSEPFSGTFQRDWYVNRVRAPDGSVRIEPVTRVLVKSVVATVEARGA